MPRFAILEHDFPTLHWDLLLEDGPACRTWRLSAPPERFPSPLEGEGARRADEGELTAATIPVFSELLPDHRLMYLDYEGPVSGDRGNVKKWDVGTFTWLTALDDRVSVSLQGDRWTGRIDLMRQAEAWRVEFTPATMQQAGKPRPAV